MNTFITGKYGGAGNFERSIYVTIFRSQLLYPTTLRLRQIAGLLCTQRDQVNGSKYEETNTHRPTCIHTLYGSISRNTHYTINVDHNSEITVQIILRVHIMAINILNKKIKKIKVPNTHTPYHNYFIKHYKTFLLFVQPQQKHSTAFINTHHLLIVNTRRKKR